MVHRFAPCLFGCHVLGSPGQQFRPSDVRLVDNSRQPKIGYLGTTGFLFEQNVARLDVAVNQLATVCGRQASRDLQARPDDLARLKPTLAPDPFFQ